MNAIVPMTTAGNAMVPTSMDSAMRLAEMMSRGKLVPNHLHNSPGDCLLVVEQSMRWGMSPFAVAQCTSVIQGKLMYEGKLVSAAIHASGILDGRLSYTFSGDGPARKIVVRGTIRGETEPRDIDVELKDAKTSNALWTKQPDQQLVYFAVRAWARRHAPEVMLGVYSPEEFDRQEPAPRPADSFTGTTIAGTVERQTVAQAIGDDLPEHAKGEAPKRGPTWRDLLDEIEADFTKALIRDEVDAVLAGGTVQKALDNATNGTRDRLNAIIRAAIDRTAAPIDNDPTLAPSDTLPGIVAETMIARIRDATAPADIKRMKAGTNAAWREEYNSLEPIDRALVDRAISAREAELARTS